MTEDRELDESLAELVSGYVDALNEGRAPPVERFLDEHADLRDQLRPLLHAAAKVSGEARSTRKAAPITSFEAIRRRLVTDAGWVIGDFPTQFPSRFGDYVLLDEIDRGGMGIVYRARQPGLDRDVALKVILAGRLATDDDKRRFLHEARTAATFKHPNIVRIHDVGEHEGCPYFTMELIEGKNLAEELIEQKNLADQSQHFRRDHRRAAKLVATVAGAVSYAHQRLILHRDLKPANILLDIEGTPFVTDFGLAKDIGNEAELIEPDIVVGTLGYMSPEQATGREDLTTRADVYSLGAILYELLTGREPIIGNTVAETRRLLQEVEPERPRKLDSSIPRDLEALCLRCLEKDPDSRYSSTALAEDLERFLRAEPLTGTPKPHWVVRWALRHPVATSIAAEVALFLVVAVSAGFSVAGAQASDRREEVLRTNVYAARTLAGSVLAQLKDYREAMTQAATGLPPALTRPLMQLWPQGGDELERYCQDLYERYDDPVSGLRQPLSPSPFNTWFILSKDGVARARWPTPPKEFLGKYYGWRDYFLGAKALALERQRSAYVSRAFLSEADGTLKFALSAPLYDADGVWIGVIVAMADSGATLGTLQLSDLNDERRTATLATHWDHTRELAATKAPYPTAYAVLVHDSLRLGQFIKLENAKVHEVVRRAKQGTALFRLDQLRPAVPDAVASDDDHRDPVEGYEGQWLAGFAPVGTTGMVVIVQTPHDTASRPNQTLARRLASWGLAYAFLGIVLLAALLIARRWAARTL